MIVQKLPLPLGRGFLALSVRGPSGGLDGDSQTDLCLITRELYEFPPFLPVWLMGAATTLRAGKVGEFVTENRANQTRWRSSEFRVQSDLALRR